jgi:hypothetical protein
MYDNIWHAIQLSLTGLRKKKEGLGHPGRGEEDINELIC